MGWSILTLSVHKHCLTFERSVQIDWPTSILPERLIQKHQTGRISLNNMNFKKVLRSLWEIFMNDTTSSTATASDDMTAPECQTRKQTMILALCQICFCFVANHNCGTASTMGFIHVQLILITHVVFALVHAVLCWATQCEFKFSAITCNNRPEKANKVVSSSVPYTFFPCLPSRSGGSNPNLSANHKPQTQPCFQTFCSTDT